MFAPWILGAGDMYATMARQTLILFLNPYSSQQPVAEVSEHGTTPFQTKIILASREANPIALFPEGWDPVVVEAAWLAAKEYRLGRIYLLASKLELNRALDAIRVNEHTFREHVHVVDPKRVYDEERTKRLHRAMLASAQRKYARGEWPEGKPLPSTAVAAMLLEEHNYLGQMLLAEGAVNVLVSGAATETRDVVRVALACLPRTQPDLGGCSFVELHEPRPNGDEVIALCDPAIETDPTPLKIAANTISTAELYQKLTGRQARVAFITIGTNGSAHGVPSIQMMAEAAKLARPALLRLGALADPFEKQMDAATLLEVALKKCPDSIVAGTANVFAGIIETQNPLMKTLQTFARCTRCGTQTRMYGPLITGVNQIISDASRGASKEELLFTLALLGTIYGSSK